MAYLKIIVKLKYIQVCYFHYAVYYEMSPKPELEARCLLDSVSWSKKYGDAIVK